MTAVEDLQSLLDEKNNIDNQQFNTRAAAIIREASRQRQAGEIGQDEYEETRHKIGDVIAVMNSPGRVAVFAAMNGADWLDENSYALGVKLTIEYTFAQHDASKQDKDANADEGKRTFNAGLKEISKMLDQLPKDVRVKALTGMTEEMQKRVIGSLSPALQLRIKRELIEAHK